MNEKEIVERIMSMHWDMKACECWICREGRKVGCSAKSEYLPHNSKKKLKWVFVNESNPSAGSIIYGYPERIKQPGRIARFFWRLLGVKRFGVPNLKEGDYPPMPKCKPPKR